MRILVRVRALPLHMLTAQALRAWKTTGWAKWVVRQPKSK
jgi:hypothetical protein